MNAEINGANIYYELLGDGEPLVLIEGWGYASWMWYRQRELAGSLRLLIYDNRGVGASSRLDSPVTMDTFADDLVGLLDHVSIGRAHVLGVSMGGMIALQFALRYERRVQSLVLCSTGPGARGKPADPSVTRIMFEPRGPDTIGWLRRKMSVAFSDRFLAQHGDEFEKVLQLRLPWIPDDTSLLNQAKAVAAFDVLDRLSDLDVPALVVAGTADRVVPPENSFTLYSRIPQSSLHLFRGAGHLVPIECADQFNRLVLDFIRNIGGSETLKKEVVEHQC